MEKRQVHIEPEVVSLEMAAVLRAMTPAERIESLRAMWRFSQTPIRAGVRMQHPDWDESRGTHEVARRVAHGSA